MLKDLIRLGLAVGAGAAVLTGYAAFRIWEQGGRDEQRPALAIVVLGAAQYNGHPSPVLAARLDHAVELYLAGLAPYFVVTGGGEEGDHTTEASVARDFAIAHGVPKERILVEDRGRTTLESLESVARLLQDRGIDDALFVSDRSHMLRVLRIASDQGLTAWGSPTPTSPSDADPGRRFDATLHELGALAYYFLTGQVPAEAVAAP